MPFLSCQIGNLGAARRKKDLAWSGPEDEHSCSLCSSGDGGGDGGGGGMGVVGGWGWWWGGGHAKATGAFLLGGGCRERPINYET